jgi:integrase
MLLDELSRWAKVARNCEENRWDLVFPAKQWGPLRHDALGKYVSIAAAAIADLPEVAPSARQDGEERYDPDVMTPRTLRHAYARLMLSLAMSLPELQLQMGHAKYSTTLRYARYELRDRPYAVRAFDSWAKRPKHGKYLRPDIGDVRKHALGKLDGKDIGDYYVGKNVGKGEA